MAAFPVGPYPLPKSMMTSCKLGTHKQTASEILVEYKIFNPREYSWKCRLQVVAEAKAEMGAEAEMNWKPTKSSRNRVESFVWKNHCPTRIDLYTDVVWSNTITERGMPFLRGGKSTQYHTNSILVGVNWGKFKSLPSLYIEKHFLKFSQKTIAARMHIS